MACLQDVSCVREILSEILAVQSSKVHVNKTFLSSDFWVLRFCRIDPGTFRTIRQATRTQLYYGVPPRCFLSTRDFTELNPEPFQQAPQTIRTLLYNGVTFLSSILQNWTSNILNKFFELQGLFGTMVFHQDVPYIGEILQNWTPNLLNKLLNCTMACRQDVPCIRVILAEILAVQSPSKTCIIHWQSLDEQAWQFHHCIWHAVWTNIQKTVGTMSKVVVNFKSL